MPLALLLAPKAEACVAVASLEAPNEELCEPLALALKPVAVALLPLALLVAPIAVVLGCVALPWKPRATLLEPVALVWVPLAVLLDPVALDWSPQESEPPPLAVPPPPPGMVSQANWAWAGRGSASDPVTAIAPATSKVVTGTRVTAVPLDFLKKSNPRNNIAPPLSALKPRISPGVKRAPQL